MIRRIIFIASLFVYLSGHSQTDSLKIQSIKIESNYIDIESKVPIEYKELSIDTIKLKIKRFKNKIEIVSHFNTSKSELKTEFYFKDYNLILVTLSEIGKLYKKDPAINYTEYYYNCGEIIEEVFYTILPSTAICMPIPLDTNWNLLYGFNKAFTYIFLRSYIKLLLAKTYINN